MAMYKLLVTLALVGSVWCDVMDRETYDDTPGNMELMYPEQNYVDMMPDPDPTLPTRGDIRGVHPTSQPRKYEDSNMRKIILYKMLSALRNHDASPSFLSVPKWITTGTVLVPPDTFNYSHLKGPLGPMFKRFSSNEISKGFKPTVRPQQKWKIKKEKAGAPLICYFKLCSFRPSM